MRIFLSLSRALGVCRHEKKTTEMLTQKYLGPPASNQRFVFCEVRSVGGRFILITSRRLGAA